MFWTILTIAMSILLLTWLWNTLKITYIWITKGSEGSMHYWNLKEKRILGNIFLIITHGDKLTKTLFKIAGYGWILGSIIIIIYMLFALLTGKAYIIISAIKTTGIVLSLVIIIRLIILFLMRNPEKAYRIKKMLSKIWL